jgi:hypothetical protein
MSESPAVAELESSIVRAVGDTAALDIASDWAEMGLDQLLDDGLVEKIPVVAHLRALWKTGRQLSDLLFTRKLFRFLSQLSSVSEVERATFVQELEQDPKLRSRVGEHVLLLLDRADDLRKPQLLAAAFPVRRRPVDLWTVPGGRAGHRPVPSLGPLVSIERRRRPPERVR